MEALGDASPTLKNTSRSKQLQVREDMNIEDSPQHMDWDYSDLLIGDNLPSHLTCNMARVAARPNGGKRTKSHLELTGRLLHGPTYFPHKGPATP